MKMLAGKELVITHVLPAAIHFYFIIPPSESARFTIFSKDNMKIDVKSSRYGMNIPFSSLVAFFPPLFAPSMIP